MTATATGLAEILHQRQARASEGLVRDEGLLADCALRSNNNKTAWAFLMNPKTGGTSMGNWVRGAMLGVGVMGATPSELRHRRRRRQGSYAICGVGARGATPSMA